MLEEIRVRIGAVIKWQLRLLWLSQCERKGSTCAALGSSLPLPTSGHSPSKRSIGPGAGAEAGGSRGKETQRIRPHRDGDADEGCCGGVLELRVDLLHNLPEFPELPEDGLLRVVAAEARAHHAAKVSERRVCRRQERWGLIELRSCDIRLSARLAMRSIMPPRPFCSERTFPSALSSVDGSASRRSVWPVGAVSKTTTSYASVWICAPGSSQSSGLAGTEQSAGAEACAAALCGRELPA